MAVTTKDLAEYLNSPPDNEECLERYLAMAKSKARAAGIPDYKHNACYDGFLLALAAMYYDNRGMRYAGSYQDSAGRTANRMVNAYVLELRNAGEDPTEETL